MKNIVYPAIFRKEQDGRYSVEFPDLGCATCGDTLEEAFLMAGDALYCWFADEGEKRPAPTPLEEIKAEDGDLVQMVTPVPFFSEGAKLYLIEEAIDKGLKERKLNKSQVATILGVDRSYITYIINGKKKPSIEMAKRIALLLDFDWQIFFEGDCDGI